MPIERRRQPVPDPSEFESPEAWKMYDATEEFLDEAPGTGKLRWQYLYRGWEKARETFLQQGETPESASQLAWGTIVFAVTDRMADIGFAVASGKIDGDIRDEFAVLDIASRLFEQVGDRDTGIYRGEFPKIPPRVS